MRALSEKRLSDYMAQQIADEILSGRIAGGTQLKQEELAEVFGASRIPIREALQVLEGQGLIVRLATRRIYAVELSEEQIQIIYEMIGDILKKAVKNLENEDKVVERDAKNAALYHIKSFIATFGSKKTITELVHTTEMSDRALFIRNRYWIWKHHVKKEWTPERIKYARTIFGLIYQDVASPKIK